MRDTRPNNADDLNPRESRRETPDPTMQMTWTPENLEERHQTQQCRRAEGHRESMTRDTRPNNADDLKPRESRWETPDPTMQMTWRPSRIYERDTRPNNADDLKPIENLDERHQTQQCRWAEPQRESRWETPDPTIQMTWTPENLDERHQTQQYRWPEPQRI